MRTPHEAALCPLRRTNMENDRISANKPAAVMTEGNRQGHGFCESCQRMRPAPARRKKGWKCKECRDE